MIPTVVLALVGCHPKMHVQYLEPAQVTLPQQVSKVAVVDRVGTDLSGEAVHTLVDGLVKSPRLSSADLAAAKAALGQVKAETGQPLGAMAVADICKATGGNGVVSLDAYSVGQKWEDDVRTESVTETQTEKECDSCPSKEVEVTKDVAVYTSTFTAEVDATWRTYACDGAVLDEHRDSLYRQWTGEGDTPGDAKSAVGDTSPLEREMAESAGFEQHTRISPYEVDVERRYYKGCSGDLRAGSKSAKAREWEKAGNAWQRATKEGTLVHRGKAHYDLAVLAEKQGDLDGAKKHLQKAKKALGERSMVEEYAGALKKRRAKAKKLEKQMKDETPELIAVPSGSEAAPAPAAEPAGGEVKLGGDEKKAGDGK